ncbi:STAS-like domain-containing protein [uncultured Reyranella sp.]|uniref:STAS-like domain-containing protein n=1 Tax=uncultured Reyranella sp. TaxID=735512 RepID=UPI0025D88FEE|nr:STAS-like domain-containing protein [uncultured Reyranella sp.]
MVILILDHVDRAYTAQDGAVIYSALKQAFASAGNVSLSFTGISDIPSSFVNSALVPFVQERGIDWLKARLTVTGATKQVASMIRRCLDNAEHSLEAA